MKNSVSGRGRERWSVLNESNWQKADFFFNVMRDEWWRRHSAFHNLFVKLIDVKLWILYLYLTNLVIRPETQSFPQSCFELSTETDLTNLVIVAFLLWILQKPILLFFLRNQLLIFSDAEGLVQEGVTWNGILQTRKALFPWITRFE